MGIQCEPSGRGRTRSFISSSIVVVICHPLFVCVWQQSFLVSIVGRVMSDVDEEGIYCSRTVICYHEKMEGRKEVAMMKDHGRVLGPPGV